MWVFFFFTHSFLALDSIKSKLIPHYIRQSDYRKLYNLISLIIIALILKYKKTLHNVMLPLPYYTIYIGLVLLIIGIFLGLISFKTFGISSFLGLKNEYKSTKLKVDGVYGYVRHPLYSALILIYTGIVLIFRTDLWLITAICGIVYLPIGIYLEEKKLLKEFPEYKSYKEKVKSVIPFVI